MEAIAGYVAIGLFVALIIWRIVWGPKPSHHLTRRVKDLLERDARQQRQIDQVIAQVETLLTNKRVKRVTIKKRVKSGVRPKG